MVSLFLIVAFQTHPVAGTDDDLQQSAGILRINPFALSEPGASLQARRAFIFLTTLLPCHACPVLMRLGFVTRR